MIALAVFEPSLIDEELLELIGPALGGAQRRDIQKADLELKFLVLRVDLRRNGHKTFISESAAAIDRRIILF
jgi:hypothetical protein